jgi:hypothetical protein
VVEPNTRSVSKSQREAFSLTDHLARARRFRGVQHIDRDKSSVERKYTWHEKHKRHHQKYDVYLSEQHQQGA